MRSSSHATAAAPRTIAAVLAVFASVQVPAATLTVRQHERAGWPVAGSTMWCIRRPSRDQVRTVVLEVARPPEMIATVWPGASGPAAWSSVTRTRQPPAGAGPATAMSPPRLTRTPQPSCRAISSAQRSAARALAVAPRSSCAPPASVARGGPVSSRTLRQPGTALAGVGAADMVLAAGRAGPGGTARAGSRSPKSRS